MAFKDNWRPRIDNVDDADVSAVNEIAEAVIANEQDIEKTYRKKEANQIFSNALKGSATGSAVRMDDASPVAHDMTVKVSGVEDASAVRVKRYGKNILKCKVATVTVRGVTFEKMEDGSYHVYGTNDGSGDSEYSEVIELPKGTYAGSGCPDGGGAGKYQTVFYDQNDKTNYLDAGKGVTFTASALHKYTVQMKVYSGQTVDLFFKPMIEVGTGDKVYETYIEPIEYPVNPDGTVEGVTSLSPTTTLMTDTEGAVIDVEYNRDLNKAVAALESIVNTMIGV